MKQTKKLTRYQHRLLQKHGIDTTGCRLVQETKEFIEYLTAEGVVERFIKEDYNE